jgi:hypothetical protein
MDFPPAAWKSQVPFTHKKRPGNKPGQSNREVEHNGKPLRSLTM